MEAFGVRKTKVGSDAKTVAYVVSPCAMAVFAVVSLLLIGGAAYYSYALEAELNALEHANGWVAEDHLDEEAQLAKYFFHSAEILLNIVESEQQTIQDGAIVSEAVLNEIKTLKERVELSESLDQLVAIVENADLAMTDLVTSFADANDLLASRAKMLSKALAAALSDDPEMGVGRLDDLDEWQEITTWHRVARCFDFITDSSTLQVPEDIQTVLAAELEVLETGEFPSGSYVRPTDVREEFQQLMMSEEVEGVRHNVMNQIDTTVQVQETLREVLQVLAVQDKMEDYEELQTQWRVDKKDDDDILAELEKLEEQGDLPLYWVAGADIMGARSRKFLWWARPSPFDVLDNGKSRSRKGDKKPK